VTRVRGRTAAQLRDDRFAVQAAIAAAIENMVAEGRLYPCHDHDEADVDGCARCQWINEQLGAGPYERPR